MTGHDLPVEEEKHAMKLNHSWLMVLCVVGMGSVFILPALGISLGSIGGLLLILLCPLSHVLMMLMMRRGHGDHTTQDEGAGSSQPVAVPRRTGETAAVKGEPVRLQD
jgi:hypothetical protein